MGLIHDPNMDRRQFLTKTSLGLGSVALSSLLDPGSLLANIGGDKQAGIGRLPLVPKAKRVIYLFQSGGPSQMELFDYKPLLNERFGQELPASIRAGQRLTGMTSSQNSFPLAGSLFDFSQHGQSAAWVSELMPHTAKIVDELCFVKSMHTEAINHDPAITFFQTGSQLSGRPSMGSWISYGLGSDNKNLPEFCVLLSRGKAGGQPLYAKLWGSGFLPSLHQGVQFRSGKDPVLYLNNPNGLSVKSRRRMLDALKDLHDIKYDKVMDPEINSRISQYEMAYRMQSSVPDTMDISKEPDYIYDMYGPDSRKPGTFAANCLLARRLAEKDVKFIQLYHQGWDQHANLPRDIKVMSKSVDQAGAALVMDLKQRGLLEDTLVVWGGEFGRTNYSQGKLTLDNYGRDHHPRCFTMWMAGGGVKKGYTHGETCEFGYNIIKDPVHVHDFQATMLHLLGVDHEKLIFKHQGRRFRLTDVSGHVVHDIIS
ncbi:DUF1501 domain-containing protein [Cyclobacterium qasimii]|uniref:Sulfatases-like protein n=2 Tax=Cyclobacterium qasimii TaxID=1350429 RepID=S7WJU3_9BACT|nr:DUF1501 domain-containing protein [Cyclobacterium qasimii]EPR66989.1 Sulfatases-like protein [Cyclobacterium qasimii M12-11B]GEO20235.1 sulfatase [Cyclobacterium qasimii]